MTEEEAKLKKQKTILPTSPHVTIYKFPLPAIASITHRATGVALYSGIAVAGVIAAFSPAEIPALLEGFKETAPVLVPVAKLLIGFPFVYHYVSGIRHIFWDETAKGLELEKVYTSTYAVMGIAAATSLSLAFVTI